MDRYEVRREVERAFARDDKYSLGAMIAPEDMSALVDVLWDYMKEADSANVARRELEELRKRIKALDSKSGQRVRCIKALPDRRALIQLGPLKEEVLVSPSVEMEKLKPGVEVLIVGSQEGRMLAAVREPMIYDGRLSKIQRVLDENRVVIEDGGHSMVLKLADWIKCEEGDEIRYDLESQMVLEVIGDREKSTFSLIEVPDQTFADVKGLSEEKKYLQERLIYPLIYRDKFEKYGLPVLKAALFHGPPGCGKAQPLDALVLTPSGYRKMGTLKPGDLISTPDGKCSKVINTFPQGKIGVYKISFSDGTNTECCENHLWSVKTVDDRKLNKPYRVISLKEMMKNLYQGSKRNYSIPMVKPIEFSGPEKKLPVDPYVFGILLGDGGFSGGYPTITTSDEEILSAVKNDLQRYNIVAKRGAKKYDYRLVKDGVKNNKENAITKILHNLEIFGRRSWEKFIPNLYKLSGVNDRIALIQGLMDSDGHVSKNGYKVSYTSTSKRLSNDVRFLAESIGCKVTGDVRKTKYKYKGLVKTGRKSYRLSISFPPNIVPFRLSRKSERFVPRTKYMLSRYIDNIEYVGEKDSQCILVNHPDHLYITNNFIVTHNTFMAGAVFNEMLNLKASMGSSLKEKTSHRGFFVINGPEVLNKWAGNTEAAIRSIFEEARKAAEGSDFPSIIFWDEIESITGKRKDTATYTPEKTVVPTLLAELQGLKSSNNVVLIGATNRPDLIDPALMRPGRLGDAILEVPRPNKEASAEILGAEFNRDYLPDSLSKLIEEDLVEELVSHVYDNPEPLAIAKTKSGEIKQLMRQEMVSGALFTQVGEELARKSCMSEINGEEPPDLSEAVDMIDNIMLTQVGVLDAGVKNGFTFNTSDYVIDVSLNA